MFSIFLLRTALFWVFYTASSGNSILTFRDNLSVPSSAGQESGFLNLTSRRKPDITHFNVAKRGRKDLAELKQAHFSFILF